MQSALDTCPLDDVFRQFYAETQFIDSDVVKALPLCANASTTCMEGIGAMYLCNASVTAAPVRPVRHRQQNRRDAAYPNRN